MRKALSREICADPRFTVVGMARNGEECLKMAIELRPDVITLDVEMPGLDGIETLRQLSLKSPAGVIMVSAATEAGAQITLNALALGAIDFIPKAQGLASLHEKLLVAAQARQARAGAEHFACHSNIKPALPAEFRASAIVIGSSTGGPQALTAILMNIAPPLPVPVFIAQHMPAPFTAALARRLSAQTGHNVAEAKDGDPIVNGNIYVAPGGMQLKLKDAAATVCPDAGESRYQPSAGVLASSAFGVYGRNMLAIMLTGLGRDGAREFARLKAAGGWTIAQDSASCTVFGMPKALIELGGACEILPPEAIARRIEAILANNS
jgi:two-component system, chemotaxis family, protein-glutamate methylesterase/glutaminase